MSAQDCDLVTQHQDLDVLGCVGPGEQRNRRGSVRRRPEWTLPAWCLAAGDPETGKIDEKHYNTHVGDRPGFLCLDRKLVYCRTHPGGFEACDLLGPNNELVHVKRVSSKTGSGPLSHLIARGIVAIESLTDAGTWQKFVEKVHAQDPARAATMGARPTTLVYAIHRSNGLLTPEKLSPSPARDGDGGDDARQARDLAADQRHPVMVGLGGGVLALQA
jgi:hypothetical protein